MTPIDQFSDEELIDQFKTSQDKKILAYLFKKYKRDLFGLAYYYVSDRETALDLTMDSFEYIIEVIGTKEIRNFKAWALGITRNKALKYFRRHVKFDEFEKSHEEFMEIDSDSELVEEAKLSNLNKALHSLKEAQRDCIVSFYLHSKTYKEIAAETGQDEKKIKSYIQNGKRNLKIILTQTKRE